MSKLDRIKHLLASTNKIAYSFGGDIKSRLLAAISPIERLKPPQLASQSEPIANPATPDPLLKILDTRAAIGTQIGGAAKNGFLPDAYIYSLYDTYVAELGQLRLQLGQSEADYQAALRRLDSMFPEAPPPPPEPPEPKSPRHFRRLSTLFSDKGQANRLH